MSEHVVWYIIEVSQGTKMEYTHAKSYTQFSAMDFFHLYVHQLYI